MFGWKRLESAAEARDEREWWTRIPVCWVVGYFEESSPLPSVGGSGSTGGSGDPRRSGITAALDVQECAQIGRGTPARRPRRQLSDGGRTAARAGLQPAGQPKDTGGEPAYGSR